MTIISSKSPGNVIASADFNAVLNKIQNGSDTDIRLSGSTTNDIKLITLSRNCATTSEPLVRLSIANASDSQAILNIVNSGTGPDFTKSSVFIFKNQLEIGTSTRGCQIYSTASDNFNIKTWTNTPNPNFKLHCGDGAGGTSWTWISAEGTSYGRLDLMPNGGYVNIGRLATSQTVNCLNIYNTGSGSHIYMQPKSSAPTTSLSDGCIYYDSSKKSLMSYDGTNWKEVGGGMKQFTWFLASGNFEDTITTYPLADTWYYGPTRYTMPVATLGTNIKAYRITFFCGSRYGDPYPDNAHKFALRISVDNGSNWYSLWEAQLSGPGSGDIFMSTIDLGSSGVTMTDNILIKHAGQANSTPNSDWNCFCKTMKNRDNGSTYVDIPVYVVIDYK